MDFKLGYTTKKLETSSFQLKKATPKSPWAFLLLLLFFFFLGGGGGAYHRKDFRGLKLQEGVGGAIFMLTIFFSVENSSSEFSWPHFPTLPLTLPQAIQTKEYIVTADR